VQGVREVPRLIASLTHGDKPDELILGNLQKVFDGAPALAKARAILAGLDDTPALY
jgi:hypothetical protein